MDSNGCSERYMLWRRGVGGGGRVGKNTSVYLPMFDSYDSFNHRGGISRAGRYIFGRRMQCKHLGVTVKTQSLYQANVGWKCSYDFECIAACYVSKKGSPHYTIAMPLMCSLQWKGVKIFFLEVNICSLL